MAAIFAQSWWSTAAGGDARIIRWGGVMNEFFQRVIRALKLEAALFEEVEADRDATTQAIGVVLLSGIAAGIGSSGRGLAGGILLLTIASFLAWVVWALVTYVIGTKILPGARTEADMGQLLRTVGFSSAPGMIQVLGVIPVLAGAVFFVASVWMLVAMVIAVRQALDYESTARAVGVCLIGWGVQIVLLGVLLPAWSPPPAV